MRITRCLAVVMLVSGTAAAQELHKPLAPIAPKDVAECEALRQRWEPVLKTLDQVHDRCFRKYLFGGDWLSEPGACGGTLQTTDKVCLPAARQENQANCESRAQVQACYDAVRAYRARESAEEQERAEREKAAAAAEQERQERLQQMRREAEQMQNAWAEQQRERVDATRRLVEEQQRAAAEAERRRRDESQRAVNEAMRELTSARDRAAYYKANAAGVSDRHVDLTAGEMHELDDLRRRAEGEGLRPRYVPAQPAPSVTPDASRMTEAVAGLLGSHAEDLVKWGLNRVEVGERMVEAWELADGYAAKFASVIDTYQYARSALAGTTTYEEDVDAVRHGTSALAAAAFSGNPAIAIQVGRAVASTADIQKAALYQIQMLVASIDTSRTDTTRWVDARPVVHALYGPFLPLEDMHRMEQIWTEAERFDAAGLATVFGR